MSPRLPRQTLLHLLLALGAVTMILPFLPLGRSLLLPRPEHVT